MTMIRTIILNIGYLLTCLYVMNHMLKRNEPIFPKKIVFPLSSEIHSEVAITLFLETLFVISMGFGSVLDVNLIYAIVPFVCITTYSLITEILYLSETYEERKRDSERFYKTMKAMSGSNLLNRKPFSEVNKKDKEDDDNEEK